MCGKQAAKIKVGILYGGCSVEHSVSINSARNADKYIDRSLFDVFLIGISKKGLWKHTTAVETEIDKKGTTLQLKLDAENPGFIDEVGEKLQLDVILPMLHGTNGEDGKVQGLLELINIPIVGSGVLGSSIAMNKLVSKQLMRQAGMPIVDFIHYRLDEAEKMQFDTIKSKLGVPFMVKAVSLGSSVGISKVNNKADFSRAVADSFQYDNDVLAEKYIVGREIECGVLGGSSPQASTPGEIIVGGKHAFYTFDAKYMDPESVRLEVPAKINKEQMNHIQSLSVGVFQLLQCRDFARVDLFVTDSGTVYINEVNTIPGFTDLSMFPLVWKYSGISFSNLISKLIYLSLDRFKKMGKVNRNFEPTN